MAKTKTTETTYDEIFTNSSEPTTVDEPTIVDEPTTNDGSNTNSVDTNTTIHKATTLVGNISKLLESNDVETQKYIKKKIVKSIQRISSCEDGGHDNHIGIHKYNSNEKSDFYNDYNVL